VSAPDRWLVLRVAAEDPAVREIAAAQLADFVGGAVEESGAELTAYLAPPADVAATLAELRGALPREGVTLGWDWLENQDWAAEWKRGLGPREVTPRLVVKPTWTTWDAAPGQIVIDVDPQMAFGTGEHATTRGCLRLLDGVVLPGERVLDVGSGSAILAIAAARLGAREAIAVEYDPDANLNARENLEQNGVEGAVRIIEAMADPALLAELGPFDLILANILSGVIRPLLPAFRTSLAPGGRLIVSGILRTEHPAVVADAIAAGFRVDQVDEEEEWWSALLRPV
jgi:ribosomal protein L11 methyltransferase